MKRSLLISLALVSACATSAMADMNGKVELGGQLVGIQGNPSKFNEYRDLGDGVTGAFDLNLSHEAYYLELFGKNFGLWPCVANVGVRMLNKIHPPFFYRIHC